MDYKKQTLLNTAANVVYLFVQWLFTVFATRLVSVEAAGILTFAVSLTNILYTVENYGMRPYQVSDAHGEFSTSQYVRLRYFTTAIGVVSCIIFLLITGYSFEKTAIIFLFFLYRGWEALSDVYYGEMQRKELLHLSAYSMIIKSVVSLILFAALTFVTEGLIVPLISINAVAAIMLILDIRIFKKLPNDNSERARKSIKAPLKVGFFMMLAMMFPILVTSLPRMFLDTYYGEELLGYFGNVSMPATLIVAIVPNILTPIMSLYGNWISEKKYAQFKKMYVLTIVGSIVLSLVFLIGFMLLGKWFMSLVYGDDIIPYVTYMYPLVITTAVYAISMCNTNALIAQRSNMIVWISSALSCVITLVCCFTLVRLEGITGLIATLAISYGAQVLVQLFGIVSKFISYGKESKKAVF